MDAPMDAPQQVADPPADPLRSSRKSIILWSLLVLAIALLIGVAVYKRQFIEQKLYGKNRVTEGSLHQKRNTVNNVMHAESVTVRTMKRMAKKNATVKTKARVVKTHADRFAYIPSQGKFIEV